MAVVATVVVAVVAAVVAAVVSAVIVFPSSVVVMLFLCLLLQ